MPLPPTPSGRSLAQIANNSLLNFTGTVTVTTGQGFSVAHDDGLTLTIGSELVIDARGPTSPYMTLAPTTVPRVTLRSNWSMANAAMDQRCSK